MDIMNQPCSAIELHASYREIQCGQNYTQWRAYIATAVLQGINANQTDLPLPTKYEMIKMANNAVDQADALLTALLKPANTDLTPTKRS